MAFILAQHLDPNQESMMVDLLAGHTSMTVRQATDGTPIEPEHLYVIPPGMYLSVKDGVLHLSRPRARRGSRMPIDFLLRSLAEDLGRRAACVILSGTMTDGSIGAKAVQSKGGLAIAQDPDEAGYEGMPRSAIETGAVDLVLPIAKIPNALVEYARRLTDSRGKDDPVAQDGLRPIVDLLRKTTDYDFTPYKPGTLQRRIARRMAILGIETQELDRYLEVLQDDDVERDHLAQDLLINVSSFFRDPAVFEYLEQTVIPGLVRGHPPDRPFRIWIAGSSTGEETYSLAILFREQIAAAKRNIKLQIFATDIDQEAIESAREGLYPDSIEANVSPARLARFFTKQAGGYRVSSELRESVVFTVQDVLFDPPFSRLDMISCRNLLIYLQPEAQKKVISLFHFALRQDGILLLGTSETIGTADDRFEIISKAAKLYRHIGHSRPAELLVSMMTGKGERGSLRQITGQSDTRQAELAALCRRLVIESYAPAAVLINRDKQCLYFLGPTDRFLRIAPGPPTQDLLSMVHQELRAKLRSAIDRSVREDAPVTVAGGPTKDGDHDVPFDIAVQPVSHEGEALALVCFLDQPERGRTQRGAVPPQDVSRVAELERELQTTKLELEGAIQSLDVSGEEQKAINEAALSLNEELQSTNEELLTSKEELESLNEELVALNSQLQEALERERTTANDLQNVLYSADVATIFLDTKLHIRLFTPAAKSLFRFLPSDVGRPLEDLSLPAAEGALLADVRTVLRDLAPIEREIQTQGAAWYICRILPYRTQDDKVEGVVITFTDITERKRVADELETAKRQAELANAAKSRFLAVASHDLRQPLQSLTFLQNRLEKTVEGEAAHKLVGQLSEAVAAMSDMLNSLLDTDQVEAGSLHVETAGFRINDLLNRLKGEFAYHAESRGHDLRVVPCSLSVQSDPGLLEQMIRNILSNAMKYTPRGKVLLGCRRHGEMLNIEIWDTGVGIPDEELPLIFEEYYQVDRSTRDPSRGLGLGLFIVRRIAELLGHHIRIRSRPGKGSVFVIEVKLASDAALPQRDEAEPGVEEEGRRTGTILVIEDDPEVREQLEHVLRTEGYRPLVAPDGFAALELAARGTTQPDLILADYNLPKGKSGLQLIADLRKVLYRDVPAAILTGDVSADTLRDIELQNAVHLSKPVQMKDLTQTIERLLEQSRSAARARFSRQDEAAGAPKPPVVYIVDDDRMVREEFRSVLEEEDRRVEIYDTSEAFLEAYQPGSESCLLVDVSLPGMDGIELLERLSRIDEGQRLTAIVITGHGEVSTAVRAMKAGASDFIEKPVGHRELREIVARALQRSRDAGMVRTWQEEAANRLADLTPRQRQILDLVLAGHPSKNIAADLGISRRTVENHRAAIMKKTGAKSLPALARLAVASAFSDLAAREQAKRRARSSDAPSSS